MYQLTYEILHQVMTIHFDDVNNELKGNN